MLIKLRPPGRMSMMQPVWHVLTYSLKWSHTHNIYVYIYTYIIYFQLFSWGRGFQGALGRIPVNFRANPTPTIFSLGQGGPTMCKQFIKESAFLHEKTLYHYSDVIMGTMASQLTSLTIVYSTVYSGAGQRKHQSSLAFVRRIHRWPVNSPHKGPVTRKMLPFDDVIMFQAVNDAVIVYCADYSSLISISYIQQKFSQNTNGFPLG